MPSAPSSRLSDLDYLRGIAALGIVAYHYTSWTAGPQSAEFPLGRVGVYGVAVFYVLSGLTMFHVYGHRLGTARQIRTFFVRRAFRIFPLLWLVTIATILLSRSWPGWRAFGLNMTGLFGFVDWDGYIALGVWSIGNELVFYALLPLIAWAAHRRSWFAVCVAVFVGIGAYFAFAVLDPSLPLAEQWGAYVNPLNQAFLFVLGFAVGKVLRGVHIPRWALLSALVAALLVFCIWPSGGDLINLVTGTNRFVFTLVCVVLCAVAYKLASDLPPILDRPLATLGEASYSVYLIHPIAFTAVGIVAQGALPMPVTTLLAIGVTLTASVLCYRIYERPLINVARQLTPTR
ncbi:acyltransferase family protein [Microbacterium murale]|nr:acyltransferase [Microbacterium murale]